MSSILPFVEVDGLILMGQALQSKVGHSSPGCQIPRAGRFNNPPPWHVARPTEPSQE
jgi:hypothetical protein